MNPITRVVCRTFPLLGSQGDVSALLGLDGVVSVEKVGAGLIVRYDAFLLDYAILEVAIVRAGFESKRGLWHRLRSAWYGFTDENARKNARAPAGGCCSRPAGIYGECKKR